MKSAILLICYLTLASAMTAQEDLLSLLEEDSEEVAIDYTIATFKTTRVINMHSIENVGKGVLDIKISHRFGLINGGISELFGIDQASIRIGGDYGISDRLMIGFGRSSFEKTYDGFMKFKLLRQGKGSKSSPATISLFASSIIKTTPFQNPDRGNLFSSRLYYTFQALVGRKFSEKFSLQLSPTLVHRNLVKAATDNNDVWAFGTAARFKLTKRTSLNAEYIYVLPNQLAPGFTNSLSIGFDIETGGHVFQLHFSNSTSMVEKGFIGETTGDWLDGDIHFGFNISRVFTITE